MSDHTDAEVDGDEQVTLTLTRDELSWLVGMAASQSFMSDHFWFGLTDRERELRTSIRTKVNVLLIGEQWLDDTYQINARVTA
jgi:hypothetical protein